MRKLFLRIVGRSPLECKGTELVAAEQGAWNSVGDTSGAQRRKQERKQKREQSVTTEMLEILERGPIFVAGATPREERGLSASDSARWKACTGLRRNGARRSE